MVILCNPLCSEPFPNLLLPNCSSIRDARFSRRQILIFVCWDVTPCGLAPVHHTNWRHILQNLHVISFNHRLLNPLSYMWIQLKWSQKLTTAVLGDTDTGFIHYRWISLALSRVTSPVHRDAYDTNPDRPGRGTPEPTHTQSIQKPTNAVSKIQSVQLKSGPSIKP